MSCSCALSVRDIAEAVREGNLALINDFLESKGEGQRGEVIRLLVKNGDPSLYNLIISWLVVLNPTSQENAIIAAAEAEDLNMLEIFYRADNVFYEDVFIKSFYRYIENTPRRHVIRFMWKHFHDYERDNVDIAIKGQFQLNKP